MEKRRHCRTPTIMSYAGHESTSLVLYDYCMCFLFFLWLDLNMLVPANACYHVSSSRLAPCCATPSRQAADNQLGSALPLQLQINHAMGHELPNGANVIQREQCLWISPGLSKRCKKCHQKEITQCSAVLHVAFTMGFCQNLFPSMARSDFDTTSYDFIKIVYVCMFM